MPADSDLTPEDGLRFFAEKIIAGEFKGLVIAMLDENGAVHTFHPEETNKITAIGLAEWAAFNLKQQFFESE